MFNSEITTTIKKIVSHFSNRNSVYFILLGLPFFYQIGVAISYTSKNRFYKFPGCGSSICTTSLY